LYEFNKQKMKAAILEKINGDLTIGEVGLTDLSFGQVLVKILVSGICGAQLQEIAGNKNNADFMPHLLGHEGCGIVEEIGVGVTNVKKGDKVVMHWRKGDGIESDFPTYTYKRKIIRSGKITTLSEYSIVSENRLTAVPHDTPNELCALLGCGLSTALGTINEEADVKFGESVLIVGVGGLGINLIKAANLASAYPIIAVDINDSKKDICESLGVHLYINCSNDSISDEIQKKFGVKEVDVIIDTSGNKKSLENTIPLLSGTGRFILVGQPKPGEMVELKNARHLFDGDGKTIKATQGGKFSPSRQISRYIRMHKAGVFSIDDIISHKMKLDDINEVINLVRSGQAGRVLIEM
jgi:S-(hydroxymethyl)glutathione dehydrogenase / alcohol dehydrogenase